MLRLIGRLSGSIDQLADRLQRIENDRRLDFLLVSAALERLLADRVGACGLLSPGKRLIVGNVEARRLVEARGRSYDAIVEEHLETKPESVERWPLLDRDSVVLGELVTVRGEATP